MRTFVRSAAVALLVLGCARLQADGAGFTKVRLRHADPFVIADVLRQLGVEGASIVPYDVDNSVLVLGPSWQATRAGLTLVPYPPSNSLLVSGVAGGLGTAPPMAPRPFTFAIPGLFGTPGQVSPGRPAAPEGAR